MGNSMRHVSNFLVQYFFPWTKAKSIFQDVYCLLTAQLIRWIHVKSLFSSKSREGWMVLDDQNGNHEVTIIVVK